MHPASHIDRPLAGSLHYRQRILVEGWIHAGPKRAAFRRIAVTGPGGLIGETRHLFIRPDVSKSLNVAPETPTGFRVLCCFTKPPDPAWEMPVVLEVRAEFADGETFLLGRIPVAICPKDYTDGAYGDLCNPSDTKIFTRKHLYSTGHPAAEASPECVEMISQYLPAGARVFDVGCGIGAYCEPLTNRGFSWLGCETSATCLRRLAELGRPHRPVRRRWLPWGYQLPAARQEFDAVIAIEVLEHVRSLHPFLSEMARVTRGPALFSVPNSETLPFLADRLAAPWHMLEGDHVNFFTRHNLQRLLKEYFRHVEIVDYGQQPLASPEGLPLPYHLLAVCGDC